MGILKVRVGGGPGADTPMRTLLERWGLGAEGAGRGARAGGTQRPPGPRAGAVSAPTGSRVMAELARVPAASVRELCVRSVLDTLHLLTTVDYIKQNAFMHLAFIPT